MRHKVGINRSKGCYFFYVNCFTVNYEEQPPDTLTSTVYGDPGKPVEVMRDPEVTQRFLERRDAPPAQPPAQPPPPPPPEAAASSSSAAPGFLHSFQQYGTPHACAAFPCEALEPHRYCRI